MLNIVHGVAQVGNELARLLPADALQLGTPVAGFLEIQRPECELDRESITNFVDSIFVLRVRAHQRPAGAGSVSADNLHLKSA